MKHRIHVRILSILLLFCLFLTSNHLTNPPFYNLGTLQEIASAKVQNDAASTNDTFTLSVEAFSVGLGYLVWPTKIPLEEGKTTAYYVDKILTDHSLSYNGGDPTDAFFYVSYIQGDALARDLSLSNAIREKFESSSITYNLNRSDNTLLKAGDVTSSSGWMSTTNNAFADVGMGLEVPSAGDVIRLQFSSVGWGEDLGAMESEWTKPYFGTIDKDALTETLADFLTHPEKDSILQKEDVRSLYEEAIGILTQMDADQTEINRIQQALYRAISFPQYDTGSTWRNFRGNDNNMAIVNTLTPTSAKGTDLKWSTNLGTDWTECPSAMILVDQSLVTMSGNKLYKLNLDTGAIQQTATMMGRPSTGAHIPPIYADGKIIVPLDDGKIQAFDAITLEPLWSYTDSLGGQALSHIAYSDGYIYTGFWNSDTDAANFVCLSTNTEEEKEPVWTFTHSGGFYWMGAVVIGNAVIVGSDSGTILKDGRETSHLYAFHKNTGETLSDKEIIGDQRSAIAYDEERSAIYFTTKAGYLYSASVDETTGEILDLKGYSNRKDNGAGLESTSTPIVYKDRVYFGLSDGTFTVSHADTLEPIYKVEMKGYPQCSFLLSTAYEAENGYLYFYGTYNKNPGGVTMIKMKMESALPYSERIPMNPWKNDSSPRKVTGTQMDETSFMAEEIFLADGFENFCIDSVICGTDGTLYYKNDSCNIFAISSNHGMDVDTPTPTPTPMDKSEPTPITNTPKPSPAPTLENPTTPKPKEGIKKPTAPKSISSKYKKKKRKNSYTITLKWKKVSKVKGYAVYLSKSKNGKYKKVKTTGKTKYVKPGYRKGTYYFKIRSYIIHNKKKVWSSYSKKTIIKIK